MASLFFLFYEQNVDLMGEKVISGRPSFCEITIMKINACTRSSCSALVIGIIGNP